ncbi:hypothetical protein BU16DRAFT_542510 [Lophium mytilinum]|uniref:Uncharacterized protein n=1 Tax=Lophium mytilinum TaxID=390894 RepID=A0A6A6QGR6_9PEZI|nr:hypothetical protein BU16DRAFT_542510 [Lophium mytilinum]
MGPHNNESSAGGPDTTTPLLPHYEDNEHDLENEKYPTHGGATTWATWGLAWTILSLTILIRWITSPTEFRPAPHVNNTPMPLWRLICLRIVEAASSIVLLLFMFYTLAKPLYLHRSFTLDGKFVVGGLIALLSDGFLNGQQYIFAWNSYAVNMGSWARFTPFHRPGAPSRYTESLLWGPPMYVYFCAGVAIVGCKLHGALSARFIGLSNEAIFALVWLDAFVFDFCVENLIISTTHAYAFSKTYGPMTLWRGRVNQFPLYESVFVATLGTLFTWMRVQAGEDGEGLSPVERGFQRWRAGVGFRGGGMGGGGCRAL